MGSEMCIRDRCATAAQARCSFASALRGAAGVVRCDRQDPAVVTWGRGRWGRQRPIVGAHCACKPARKPSNEVAAGVSTQRCAHASQRAGTRVSNGTIRSSVGAPDGLSCRPSQTGIRMVAFAPEASISPELPPQRSRRMTSPGMAPTSAFVSRGHCAFARRHGKALDKLPLRQPGYRPIVRGRPRASVGRLFSGTCGDAGRHV